MALLKVDIIFSSVYMTLFWNAKVAEIGLYDALK